MQNHARLTVSALACGLVLLAGCGGGGGGSDAGTPSQPSGAGTVTVPQTIRSVAADIGSQITADNYASFTGPLARAVLSSTGDSVIGSTVGNGSVGAAAASSRATAQSAGRAAPSAGHATPAASTTQTTPCTNAGTLTITANDADGNATLSVGDTLTLQAAACVISLGQTPTDGGFTLTIKAVDLDSGNNATGLDATGTLTDFSVGSDATLNGPFELWAKQTSPTAKQLRLSYTDVSSLFGSESVHYDFDIDVAVSSTGATYAINGGFNVAGQVYKIAQSTAFTVATGDEPTAGEIVLADAAGDKLQLTARTGGLLDFAFYPAGSSTPSATLPDQTWDSFRAAP